VQDQLKMWDTAMSLGRLHIPGCVGEALTRIMLTVKHTGRYAAHSQHHLQPCDRMVDWQWNGICGICMSSELLSDH